MRPRDPRGRMAASLNLKRNNGRARSRAAALFVGCSNHLPTPKGAAGFWVPAGRTGNPKSGDARDGMKPAILHHHEVTNQPPERRVRATYRGGANAAPPARVGFEFRSVTARRDGYPTNA